MTAVRGLVCAIAVAGCGRTSFDPLGDAAGGTDDTAAVDCWPAWRSGSPTVSPPRLISELSTAAYEGDPYLAADGQTLYFARFTGGTLDVFTARRSARGAPFLMTTPEAELTSTDDDHRVSLTGDGLIAALSSNRGPAGFELWLADRSSTAVPFGNLSQTLVAALNTTQSEYDPELTRDGTRLYYAAGPLGMHQVMVASRADRTAAFAPPAPVGNLVAATITADSALSPDELVIVYSATITAEPFDIYFATRSAIGDAFGPSTPIASVNMPGFVDGDAALSPDGCELFFASERSGQRDLLVSDITPQ